MNKLDKESIIGISALLVHAANIDEIYSEHEKLLVKDFIKSYLKDEDANQILNEVLMVEFGGDWNLLLKDMEIHAVSDEEYELAAEIRDYLQKHNENG